MLLMPIVHALAAEEHGGIHQNANCDVRVWTGKRNMIQLGA